MRASLQRMDETRSLAWVQGQILQSIAPVLGLAWILDIDSTVKPLYGHQQGAQISCNPHKPGRPSDVYHSDFFATLSGAQGAGRDEQGSAPWSGRIAVLITTLVERAYPGEAIAKLYREHGDAENSFDELKNQWGWNGLLRAAPRRSPLRGSLRLAVSLGSRPKSSARAASWPTSSRCFTTGGTSM